MDSGNSGSLQSSSGGEEEYDSRGESSISSFLNSSGHFASISDPQSGQLLSHHQQPTLFISNNAHINSQNFDAAFPQSSGNSQFGNDLLWSRGLRSEPNYGNFGNLTGLSSSTQSVLGTHHQVSLIPSSSSPTSSLPSHYSTELQQVNANANANAARASSDQPNTVKNPKKRTRASRRAPTTVLTTDTTNFRQMVQEFTGIPTAPFSASPYSRRLDLFSSPSTMRSSAGHNNSLDALGPLYPPLRPSPQKLQLNPFFPPSSSPSPSPSLLNMDPLVVSTTNTGTTTSNAITPNLLGLQKQPQQDLLNMHQNQMLANFHQESSSLHPSLKHPTTTSASSSASVLTTKSQATAANTTTVPSFDDLGLSRRRHHHENVNTNQLLAGFPTHHQPSSNITNDQEQQLGSSSSQQRIYKFNCSVSTSEFLPDKGLENVTTSAAGEGTVGSWICPSD